MLERERLGDDCRLYRPWGDWPGPITVTTLTAIPAGTHRHTHAGENT